MSSAYPEDTITAIATAPGQAGIGVVRVSGPFSSQIAVAMLGFCPEPRVATYSSFLTTSGEVLDQGLALFFAGPRSFTGEDVLELQGHGGPVVLDMVLSRVLELGARMAEPGEFTKRAFLNDKLDLTQAEAISDLISSSTRQAASGAMRSLQGSFSVHVNDLISNVTKLRVYVEAAIDFPEEEVNFLADDSINTQLRKIIGDIQHLIKESNTGRLLSDGASVVLLGKPNAGKSSLLAAITNANPKIANYQFTTLNPNLGVANYDDKEVTIADIPGLVEGAHKGTGLGIKFLKHIERCKSLLHLIDITNEDIEKSYNQVKNELKNYSPKLSKKPELIVLNKIDLLKKSEIEKIINNFSKNIKSEVVLMSTIEKKSISKIKAKLISYAS